MRVWAGVRDKRWPARFTEVILHSADRLGRGEALLASRWRLANEKKRRTRSVCAGGRVTDDMDRVVHQTNEYLVGASTLP